jgi:PAS domain S-box-containing protein
MLDADLVRFPGSIEVADDTVLALVLEATNTGLWIWDVASDHVRWSPEAYRIHGLKPGEFAHTSAAFFAFVHPEDRARVHETVGKAVREHATYCAEFRILRADGTTRWLMSRGRASYDIQGTPATVLGTITDVTEHHLQVEEARRASEEALRRTNELFETTLVATPVAVYSQDRDLRYTWIHNPAPGFAAENVVGRRDTDLMPRRDEAEALEAIKREVLRTGAARRTEMHLTLPGGARTYELFVRPQRNAAGALVGVLGAAVDVTGRIAVGDLSERERFEAQLRQSEATLRLAMDAAGMSSWHADLRAGILEFSAGAAALHGTLRTSWPLDEGLAFVEPVDRARVTELLARVAADGGSIDTEYRAKAPDGTARWVATFARALLDDEGKPTGRLIGAVRDVTERRLAEGERERDRALLDAVLQSMPAGVIIADPAGRLLRWNDANEVLWGLHGVDPTRTADVEAYGEWKGWWYPGGKPLGAHDWAMARALERRERVTGDVVEIQRFDGSGRRVIVNMGAPVLDQAGTLLGAVVVQTDITESVRAEKAMRASEARLRQIIDSMFAFVGMLEPDGTLVEVNRAPLEVAGLARSDVVGRKFWDCAWWTHDDAVRARLADAFRRATDGEVVRYDEVIRIAGNGRMTIDFLMQPVFEDGRLVCVIPSGVDVTARQRMEANLRVSERRFRVAVEATSGIIWSNDREGRMSGEQPGWAAFTGQTPAEYEGHGWAAAVHPDDAAPTVRAWQAAVAAGSKFEFEHRVRRHDGQYRTFQVRALPVRGQDGEVREWVGVHTDITDVRAANEALQEADRRKDEFLATLRTSCAIRSRRSARRAMLGTPGSMPRRCSGCRR